MSLVSKNCVNFVKNFEGFSATPYRDEVGVLTLGYGMTGSEIAGIASVTEEQATGMLENLLNDKYAQPIKNDLDSKGVDLNQNQFDALVSMAYNVGVGGLLGSTLYRNICNGVRDVDTITSDFEMWDKAGGQVLQGLLRRRKGEAAMFFGSGNTADGFYSKDFIKSVQHDLQRVSCLASGEINADGIVGPKTEAAIKQFRYIVGLSDSNVIDSNLVGALNAITKEPIIGNGWTSNPAATKFIQWYLGIPKDGIFGSQTQAAVKAWQIKSGIWSASGADGVIREKDWDKILK